MRRILLSAVAAGVLGVVSLQGASAADIPAPVYKAAPAPVWSWTGIYIGAVGSYGWADAQHCQIGFAVPCLATGPFTNMKGWLGGITVGANYQFNNIVLGVEGDWSGGRLTGSSPSTATFGCGGTCDNKITSVATLRGRLGLAWNRVMLYGTAGGAWERLEASIGTPVLASGTTTRSNFVWGVGAEAGITEAQTKTRTAM